MFSSVTRLSAAVLLPISFAVGQLAHAQATFDAFAEGSLDYDDKAGLIVDVLSDTDLSAVDSGNGFAEADASVENSDSIEGGLLLANVFGNADRAGSADAEANVFSIISFSNTTDADITTDLLFAYDIFASAGVADPAIEESFSEASLRLAGGDIDESFSVFADTTEGVGEDSTFDELLLGLSVPAGETLDLELSGFVFGGAAAVPLPAAAWLLLSALGMLGVIRRRRA